MKRHWKSIALAALSALGSMVVAALSRQHEKEDGGQKAKAPEAGASQRESRAPGAAGVLADHGTRAAAVNFLSDVLAETYRKVRSQEGKSRR